jgi:hypothetical protein
MSYTIPDCGVSPSGISIRDGRIYLSKDPRPTPKNPGASFCLMNLIGLLFIRIAALSMAENCLMGDL